MSEINSPFSMLAPVMQTVALYPHPDYAALAHFPENVCPACSSPFVSMSIADALNAPPL